MNQRITPGTVLAEVGTAAARSPFLHSWEDDRVRTEAVIVISAVGRKAEGLGGTWIHWPDHFIAASAGH